MAIDNFDEVKEYLEQNKEVEDIKNYFDEIKGSVEPKEVELTKDLVSNWLQEHDEGKAFTQSFTDQRVSQAIKTFKEGHFEEEVKQRVETRLREMNPKETPEQARLREVEQKLAMQEKVAKRAELSKMALQYSSQKHLDSVPEEVMAALVRDTEEETRTVIDRLKEYIMFREEKKANSIMSKNSYQPESGDGDKGIYSTQDELIAAIKKAGNDWRKNPTLVKEYERMSK
jgi:hypothetical protein